MIVALAALPAYSASNPKKTSLSKSIEPTLKQWEPISVLEQDGKIYVRLPRPEITDLIYSSIIRGGLCLGKMFNEEADWSGIKSITITNEAKTQGFVFNGGEKECESINNVKMGETSPLIHERKSVFTGKDPASHYTGAWMVDIERSKIDDSTNVYLSLYATNTFINDFGLDVRPTLFIRCAENKTNVGVNWDTFLDLDTIPVLHRMGKEKAKTTEWRMASNHLAAFAPSPIGFLRQLIKHEDLLIQTTPYGENKVTAEFHLDGLKNAIEPLQEACGWR